MILTKKEVVDTCLELMEQGYTRCKDDKGYEEGRSIQEYFEKKYETEVPKSEIRSWFSTFDELKGIRVKKRVFTIVDDAEETTTPEGDIQDTPETVSNEVESIDNDLNDW